MSEKKRVLVVDDEPDFAAIVQTNLEKEGFEVEVAYNASKSKWPTTALKGLRRSMQIHRMPSYWIS